MCGYQHHAHIHPLPLYWYVCIWLVTLCLRLVLSYMVLMSRALLQVEALIRPFCAFICAHTVTIPPLAPVRLCAALRCLSWAIPLPHGWEAILMQRGALCLRPFPARDQGERRHRPPARPSLCPIVAGDRSPSSSQMRPCNGPGSPARGSSATYPPADPWESHSGAHRAECGASGVIGSHAWAQRGVWRTQSGE